MARSGRYKVKFRRRRKGKTDHRSRLALVKSGRPRIVIRKTGRYVLAQFIEAGLEGDKIIARAFSKELEKFGWTYSPKNIPAAYLTGYLAALRGKRGGINEAVLDSGRYVSTRGSRVYAALKGALDAGIVIAHADDVVPTDGRIKGSEISSWATKLKKKEKKKYKSRFSGYLRRGVDPEHISEVFETTLEKISEAG